jgi:hypothetical protein
MRMSPERLSAWRAPPCCADPAADHTRPAGDVDRPGQVEQGHVAADAVHRDRTGETARRDVPGTGDRRVERGEAAHHGGREEQEHEPDPGEQCAAAAGVGERDAERRGALRRHQEREHRHREQRGSTRKEEIGDPGRQHTERQRQ